MDEEEQEEQSLRIIIKKVAPHLDINTKDQNGASPLILAALNGHCSIVQVLLTYSANIWATDLQGCVVMCVLLRNRAVNAD